MATNNVIQPSNDKARTPMNEQVSKFESWKETLASLAPLLLLALIFIAAWGANPTTEFFQAHLAALQEHSRTDEVTPFYLVTFFVVVIAVPFYVCFLQWLVSPEVYNRNEIKFILISVLLGLSMFLAMFLNTVGISVQFGWPFSLRQTVTGWFLILSVLCSTALGIFIVASSRRGNLRLIANPVLQWILATNARRRSYALLIGLGALVALLNWEMMVPEVKYSAQWTWRGAPFSFAGTPLSQIMNIVLLWLILFYSLSAVRLPGITVFFGLCLIWAFFDRADNHYFRQSQSETRAAPDLASSFQSWLKERVDTASFKDSYYPVYIVAAEGGGMYAAYHTGTILARIQDSSKSFAEHVFAISSVSGGSLGAAIFSGLVKHGGVEGRVEANMDVFLSQDLLTNVFIRATTSDLAQRALPMAFGSLDRARGLEYAVEKAWQRTLPAESSTNNPFAVDFSALWLPNGTAPALFLNTTEVETGDRVVISPFSLKAAAEKSGVLNLRALQDEVPGIDLPLSTAVVLSARFPYLTPAGSYMRGGQKHRLVDGGYFDNTGIETALDLIHMLESEAQRSARALGLQGIRFILLSISTAGSEGAPAYSFDEIMSPVRTMVATWRSRGPISVRNADRELNGPLDGTEPGGKRFRRIVMAPGEKALPLTWYLSSATRARIRKDLTATTTCSLAKGAALLSPTQSTRATSSCVLASVISELPGTETGSTRRLDGSR